MDETKFFLTQISKQELAAHSRVIFGTNAEKLHKSVMKLFPPHITNETVGAREALGVLFCETNTKNKQSILVQSKVKPEKSVGNTLEVDLPDLKGAYEIKVRLNNVYRDSKTKKLIRVPDESLETWIRNKFQGNQLDRIKTEVGMLQRKKRPLCFVDVRAVLTVNNEIELKTQVMSGVGRSKAYGCGMILLQKIRQ